MKFVFRQTSLYRFLIYCNKSDLDNTVLDCGAGGNCPPLALFSEFGYKTYGIEIDDSQIEQARAFGLEHNVDLNILKGDMRELPFEDESISYIYSYNTIFHMTKKDITKTVNEIKRVLKPGGLCFINFLTTNDGDYGTGEKVGEGEFYQEEGDGMVIHTYHDVDETDSYFKDMTILFKENRVPQTLFQGEVVTQGYVDYIVKK